MKLRTQILCLGLAGAALVSAAGGIGLLAVSSMATKVEASALSGQALQAALSADMMHDALRGDAQRALLAVMKGDTATIAAARTDLDDHVATLDTALKKIAESGIDAESKKALDNTLPVVAQYMEAARAVVSGAAQGVAEAEAQIPALNTAFAQLEDQLENLSGLIEEDGAAISEAASASVSQSLWTITIAVLVATVVLVAGALWVAQLMAIPMGQAVTAAGHLADGNLTMPIALVGNDDTRQLLEAMRTMQQRISQTVSHVQDNAALVSDASAQIAQGNTDLSTRTEQQASALEETAASMEELGTTVRQTADHASKANELALNASQVAVEGGDVVGKVVETMKGINESSKKIADIIGVIDGIAFQTNILALNAAVEAARAGEQGRGFAVVASEVRNLAQRSAQAAREIKGLIDTSVERVASGTVLADQAGVTMQGVVSAIRRVSDLVGEISSATGEQSAGVGQVGEAISQMDKVTQQNAALVEESAAAAESLKTQALQLVQAVSVFRLNRQPLLGSS
ncbi:MAG: HAMP domain-containing protein [Hydrogenophaga sp.]|jgi:methyl-accepting chemotaxis protein|uniref:methyl-accepting chemotaxis protein n=1 Tax=Hydrogenophaga sp. TaxID=1904254 RepID=UPI002635E4FD|nr:methyl-accepting chemotaxis protein [Hydrogenophaga sp.]MCV0439267.1 HAMP domain-containing protein [Hydrogenophaga sp.]